MRIDRRRKRAIQMFEDHGLRVAETRGGHGSHLIFTLEYRGFHKITTVAMTKDSGRALLNREADLIRFKRIVDDVHAGGTPPLPAGVYRA